MSLWVSSGMGILLLAISFGGVWLKSVSAASIASALVPDIRPINNSSFIFYLIVSIVLFVVARSGLMVNVAAVVGSVAVYARNTLIKPIAIIVGGRLFGDPFVSCYVFIPEYKIVGTSIF